MEEYRQLITRKYRHIARLPDFLFAFTFPLRRRAVARLQLPAGGRVLEVGCSSGANFNLLVRAVGDGGAVVGVDLSPDMAAQARKRVAKAGWKNVAVVEDAAETITFSEKFDGLMLFAMHDALVSPQALDNILACLKPGGCVVAAGPMTTSRGAGRIFNPMIGMVYKRFAVNTQDKDKPWRLLAERVPGLQVEIHAPGIMYLVWGKKDI